MKIKIVVFIVMLMFHFNVSIAQINIRSVLFRNEINLFIDSVKKTINGNLNNHVFIVNVINEVKNN